MQKLITYYETSQANEKQTFNKNINGHNQLHTKAKHSFSVDGFTYTFVRSNMRKNVYVSLECFEEQKPNLVIVSLLFNTNHK